MHQIVPIRAEDLLDLCYCTCCCLSEDPEDSRAIIYQEGERPYTRRFDCSCKRRWPFCLDSYDTSADQFARLIVMRARDCGREEIAAKALEALRVLDRLVKDLDDPK